MSRGARKDLVQQRARSCMRSLHWDLIAVACEYIVPPNYFWCSVCPRFQGEEVCMTMWGAGYIQPSLASSLRCCGHSFNIDRIYNIKIRQRQRTDDGIVTASVTRLDAAEVFWFPSVSPWKGCIHRFSGAHRTWVHQDFTLNLSPNSPDAAKRCIHV
ncbi:hypothetical protein FRC08_011507 [Ceratobasidium sp. 394]|nr:hypothetical protein FRC08_011507 [Ceratobasidium sp. 394]